VCKNAIAREGREEERMGKEEKLRKSRQRCQLANKDDVKSEEKEESRKSRK